MLARDVLFFRELDVDMLGMGPYLPHADTPLTGAWAPAEAFQHALLMLAVCRLVLRDVNLAASTALQAVVPDGREQGLGYGANVVMPNLTPARYRADYRLYDGKPCLDEEPAACRDCLAGRVRQMGRQVKRNEWGDAPHAARRDPAATRA
jgi:biotin synthase